MSSAFLATLLELLPESRVNFLTDAPMQTKQPTASTRQPTSPQGSSAWPADSAQERLGEQGRESGRGQNRVEPRKQSTNDSGSCLGPAEKDLVAWLQAEELGQEAQSEHALLELLSHLPESGLLKPQMSVRHPGRATGAGLPGLLERDNEDFTDRLIRRIETASSKRLRWTAVQTVLIAAASVVVCWLGILLVAMFFGLDLTATTTASEALARGARTAAELPVAVSAAASNFSSLWIEVRSATLWLYSPWLLLAGWLSFGLASVALAGLKRLLPEEKSPMGSRSPSLGVV